MNVWNCQDESSGSCHGKVLFTGGSTAITSILQITTAALFNLNALMQFAFRYFGLGAVLNHCYETLDYNIQWGTFQL